ncbi:MAG: zf-HC2 domain-containing protein [Oscillospiraceae bacterium]|nr:zf-HC2 domain-containing protein [Oscillospiraceae bacterium]
MSDCGRYLEMLSAFMDGELDDSLRNELSEHINSCRSCYNAALSYREIKDLLADEASMAEPPADISRLVMTRLEREDPTPSEPEEKNVIKPGFWASLPSRTKRYAGLAAVLVLLVITVVAAPAIFGSGKSNARNKDSASTESLQYVDVNDTGNYGSAKHGETQPEASPDAVSSFTAGGDLPSSQVTGAAPAGSAATMADSYTSEEASDDAAPEEPVRDGGSGAEGAFVSASGHGTSPSDTLPDGSSQSRAPAKGDITDEANGGPIEINGYSCGAIMVLDEKIDPPDVLEQYKYYSWDEEDNQYLIISGELFSQLTESLDNMKMSYILDRYGQLGQDTWLLLITALKQ